MPPPEIPQRYSSLVSAKNQTQLENIKKRKVSITSQISFDSSAEDFIQAKEGCTEIDLEYVNTLKDGLREAHAHGALDKSELLTAVADLNWRRTEHEEVLIVHKRQRKIITEDLEDQRLSYSSLEEAYTNVLVNKVMSASAKQRKSKFPLAKFRKAVDEYYKAAKEDEGGLWSWCHALGVWQIREDVKAAHIAPKSLESADLAYLFGVGETVLLDPSNGLTLSSKVELALDTGLIVLVPVKKGEESINWKIILTDQTKKKFPATTSASAGRVHWNDLDGKELEFCGSRCPARRFLYFRYVMTYLSAKKNGNQEWVERVESKGFIWATPGPYLRRSMLITLARRVSDHYLPEAFYEGTTFTEVKDSPQLSESEERIAAMSLAGQMEMEEAKQKERNRRSNRHDDDSDDETDESDED